MDLLQAIESIVRRDILHQGPIVLTEGDPQSTCDPITLIRQGRAVVLQPDRIEHDRQSINDRLFPWFNHHDAGLSQLCDYIIFHGAPSRPRRRSQPQLFVFLCELKSGKRKGATRQVPNARLVSDHILAMARHHREVTEAPEICYRALVFSVRSKTPKGSQKAGKFHYPGRMERMPDVKVAYLGCGTTVELAHLCDR